MLCLLLTITVVDVRRLDHARSPGSAMMAVAEANRLSIINCITLTMDGQYVITASLCGPPQVRDVMVRSQLVLLLLQKYSIDL